MLPAGWSLSCQAVQLASACALWAAEPTAEGCLLLGGHCECPHASACPLTPRRLPSPLLSRDPGQPGHWTAPQALALGALVTRQICGGSCGTLGDLPRRCYEGSNAPAELTQPFPLLVLFLSCEEEQDRGGSAGCGGALRTSLANGAVSPDRWKSHLWSQRGASAVCNLLFD